ncbi:MAG: hypothetical protein JNN13_18315 [Planctomycetes bacterium]|nr:hypothetical protein [Planctomycetota bacterium]
MNLVLVHCWREWRAQRWLLLGYVTIVTVALALGFSLLPQEWWAQVGSAGFVLSCFLLAGALGVVLFVAPGLVQREFGAKGDQFVRRLPGGLRAAFGGKLLFLGLGAAAIPLLTVLAGRTFLWWKGRGLEDLFAAGFDGEVGIAWPWLTPWIVLAMLMAPWVWAIGTWLPRGRMAVGGAVLLGLVLAIAAALLCAPSPGIEGGIAWLAWWWWVPVGGIVVAAASWLGGRRGGGAVRSAGCGAVALGAVLVPPAGWFAVETWRYHHPDPRQLVGLDVEGLTPDHRAALVWGAADERFRPVPLRIDLTTGGCEQLGGLGTSLESDLMLAHAADSGRVRRWWRRYEWNARKQRFDRHELFDLATGEVSVAPFDHDHLVTVLTPAQQAAVVAQARAATMLRAPGGRAAWLEGDDVCIAGADGGPVERVSLGRGWQVPHRVTPAGHGFLAFGQDCGLFDLTLRRWWPFTSGTLVRGELLESHAGGWQKRSVDGVVTALPDLRNAVLLGVLDDDRVLLQRGWWQHRELIAYRVADGRSDRIEPPPGTATSSFVAEFGLRGQGSLLPRDPRGGVWLSFGRGSGGGFLRLDVATLTARRVLPRDAATPWFQDERLLAFPDDHTALLQAGDRIVRADVDTGVRTVLFPR